MLDPVLMVHATYSQFKKIHRFVESFNTVIFLPQLGTTHTLDYEDSCLACNILHRLLSSSAPQHHNTRICSSGSSE